MLLKKILIRFMALILLVCFTGTEVLYAARPDPDAHDPLPSESGLKSRDRLAASLRSIPSELADISGEFLRGSLVSTDKAGKRRKTESLPLVIHIQDAHGHVEAQKRISEILHWIKNRYDEGEPRLPFILAMEGSEGLLRPEYLNFFDDYGAANKGIAEALLKKAELSGPEYFLWEQYSKGAVPGTERFDPSSKAAVIGYGIEDPELYRKSLARYRDLLRKKEEVKSLLMPYRALIDIAQSRFLAPELRDFIKNIERSAGISSGFLKHISGTLNIRLEEKAEQIRFPNLARYHYLKEYEPLLDKKLAELEWQSLIPRIQESPVYEALAGQIRRLLEKPEKGAVRNLRRMFAGFYKEDPALEELFRDYPHLTQWISYYLIRSELMPQGFLRETGQLQDAVLNRLAKTPREKEFLRIYRDLQLLEKLLFGETTRDEFERVSNKKGLLRPSVLIDRIEALLQNERGIGKIVKKGFESRAPLNQFFKEAFHFYEEAKMRDASMLSNALQFFENKKREYLGRDTAEAGIVVLVTGGFHTEGMTQVLKNREIPHMVLSPRINPSVSHNFYHAVMTGTNAGLRNYFPERTLSKQETLFLKQIIETAPLHLNGTYHFGPEQLPGLIAAALKRHPVLSEKLSGKVFQARERPFLRVQLQQSGPPLNLAAQAISEIRLLTRSDRYGFLASSPDVSPAERKRFSVYFRRLGYPVIRNESSGGSIVPELLSDVIKSTGSDIDKATVERWGKVLQEVSAPASTRTVKKRGPRRRQRVRFFRSELRSVDEIPQILTDNGIGPEILKDDQKLLQALNQANLRAGGAEDIMRATGGEGAVTTLPIPERISGQRQIDYLRRRASGQVAFGLFAGGSFTRMGLPLRFQELGISGLNPNILTSLPDTDDAGEKDFETALHFLEDVAEGRIHSSADLTVMQRQLLQLRYQTERMVEKNPDANLSVEEILAKDIFIVIASEENIKTLARAFKAINFAGLKPERIFLLRQEKKAGKEILENGELRDYKQKKWPEGHGDALASLWTDARNLHHLDEEGNLVNTGKPLMSVLRNLQVKDLMLGKGNDLPFFRDMALAERWATARDAVEQRGAEMVVEVVENRLGQNMGVVLPAAHEGIQLRDTLAVQGLDLGDLRGVNRGSRMLYFFDVISLPPRFDEKQLPAYLRIRKPEPGKNVLSLERVSGDISSILKSYAMEREGETLETLKVRGRAEVALSAMATQDIQPGFLDTVKELTRSELRFTGLEAAENFMAEFRTAVEEDKPFNLSGKLDALIEEEPRGLPYRVRSLLEKEQEAGRAVSGAGGLQWKQVWRQSRWLGALWLLEKDYLHLEEQAEESMNSALDALSRANMLQRLETGEFSPMKLFADGRVAVPRDRHTLENMATRIFGSGLLIRLSSAPPGLTLANGAGTEAVLTAVLLGLMQMRENPSEQAVRIEAPLNLFLPGPEPVVSLDDAGGLPAGAPVTLSVKFGEALPLRVEIERLPAGEFYFEDLERGVADDTLDFPAPGDPLQLQKMALIFAASLGPQQKVDDPRDAAVLSEILLGLIGQVPYGHRIHSAAVRNAAIFNRNMETAPSLQTLPEEGRDNLSPFLRWFTPGFSEPDPDEIRKRGRESLAYRLVDTSPEQREDAFFSVPVREIAARLIDLRVSGPETGAEELSGRMEKILTLFRDSVPDGAGKTPAEAFLQELRERYETETNSPLLMIRQEPGPAGYLLVAAHPETLDRLAAALLQEDTGIRTPVAGDETAGVPVYSGIRLTAEGYRKTFYERAALRDKEYQLIIQAQLKAIRQASYDTARLREELRLFGSSTQTLEDLFDEIAGLRTEFLVSETVGSGFLNPEIFSRVPLLKAWRFIQLIVLHQDDGEGDSRTVRRVRNSLGPAAAFFESLESPVTFIKRYDASSDSQLHFRMTGALAAAYENLQFSYLVGGDPKRARGLVSQLVDQLRLIELSEDEIARILSRQVEFVPSSAGHEEMARTVMQIWSNDQKKNYAVLDDALNYLQAINYVPGMVKVNHESIDFMPAVLITAALIHEMLTDNYDEIRLSAWGARKNIDVQTVFQAIDQLVKTLEHISTQA